MLESLFGRKRPESHVDDTEKSGSFRVPGKNEPMPKEPTEDMAHVLELAAFQEKLTDKVRAHLKTLDWKASDVMGNEKVVDRIAKELNLHWGGVNKAIRTIMDEEREKNKSAA